MQNAAKTGPETAVAATGTKTASLGERVLDELKKFVVITLYLWALFVLFATYC